MPAWMNDDLADHRRRGLYRRRRRLQSAQGVHVRWRNRDYLNFSSNDYLNLAADPRLARAAARTAQRFGCGTGASPLVSGHLPPLRALERDLAQWQACEGVLLFNSGYAANLAVISSLAGRDDVVFSDALNHASLIDGCRLSRASVHVYRHADVAHLSELLDRHGRASRRRLIVTDSIFSMDGDLAPLAALMNLAEERDAMLVVDEAHATGVFGDHGRGVLETVACPAEFDRDRLVKVGTLSKALGSQGGFVCGTRTLIDWLVNHARPYIFSTALAPPCAAAARAAVRIVQSEPERRRHLLALGEFLREQLTALGVSPGVSCCQIVPVMVGGAREAVALARQLEERGLLVPAIRPPSVPEGTSRLRISLSSGHTRENVVQLAEALR
jgi:8-amino-7-oxononanoate synthase